MEKDSGIIFDIKHFAIHDGPGIRTTVFFKGCPLSCWWCHNPESQNPEKEEMIEVVSRFKGKACSKEVVGYEITTQEVMTELLKDVIFYDESEGGVTFSGGEPLLQSDFLFSLLETSKKNGFHTCLDTSGYAPRLVLENIIDFVDLFLYDLKLIDNDLHKKYTGVTLDNIKANLEYLCEKEKLVIIRIPLIPGITDTEENISQIGDYISKLSCVQQVDILPYNKMGEDKYRRLEKPYLLNNTNSQTNERISQIKEHLESHGLTVKIGG